MFWFTTKNRLIRVICFGNGLHWLCFDSLQRIGSLESFVRDSDYTCYVLIHYKESAHSSHLFGIRTTLVMFWFTTKNRLIRVICSGFGLHLLCFDSLQRIGSLESFVLETDYTGYVLIHYKESAHSSHLFWKRTTLVMIRFTTKNRLIRVICFCKWTTLVMFWFTTKNRLVRVICFGNGLHCLCFDSLQRIGSLESFVLETNYTVYVLIHYKESAH